MRSDISQEKTHPVNTVLTEHGMQVRQQELRDTWAVSLIITALVIFELSPCLAGLSISIKSLMAI